MNMKKFVMAACCVLALGSATAAYAGEKSGGCGIGKEIMAGKTGLGPNLVAAILNNILIPNTFFMSTGILGCDTTKSVKNEQQGETFVASNMDTLAVEMAQGNGDHLAALASILGVADQDKSAFFSLAKDQYEPLFSATGATPSDVLTTFNTAMLNDPRLSQYVAQ